MLNTEQENAMWHSAISGEEGSEHKAWKNLCFFLSITALLLIAWT